MRRTEPSETGSTWPSARLVALVAALEERKDVRIEQLAAAPRHPVAVAVVDQPEQGEQPAPGAAPLVHRVGVERLVVEQPGIERLDRIAALPERLRCGSREEGSRSRSSA